MPWSEKALSYVKKLSASINTNHYLPFIIDGSRPCGLIHKDYVSQFQKRPDLFDVTDHSVKLSKTSSKDVTSNVINQFLLKLRNEGTFAVLKGNFKFILEFLNRNECMSIDFASNSFNLCQYSSV